MSNSIGEARDILINAFEEDPDFRHVYIANIACAIYDNKHIRISMSKCNDVAENVFKRIFGRGDEDE